MMYVRIVLPVVVAALVAIPTGVESHGRLIEPPSRSTMWRYGGGGIMYPKYSVHETESGNVPTPDPLLYPSTRIPLNKPK